jgi:hypothetical protein
MRPVRRIVTKSDVAAIERVRKQRSFELHELGMAGDASTDLPSVAAPDRYMEALGKLIPPEIVAAFLAIDGIVRGSKGVSIATYWVVSAMLVILCAWWVKRTSTIKSLPTAWRQIIASTIAFCIWVYAIGGPFQYAELSWYSPSLGGILAILSTLIAPLVLGSRP